MHLSVHEEPEASGEIDLDEIKHNYEYDRFYNMKGRNKAIDEIVRTKDKLWKTEQALNTPLEERFRLEKGWMSWSRDQLAELGARVSTTLTQREVELRMTVDAYGKADDIRKEIDARYSEYRKLCKEECLNNTFSFPPGFQRMNSYELQRPLQSIKDCFDQARVRIDQKAAEAEIRAQHELELKRINDERSARRDTRKAELDEILRPYTETVTKILEHPVFRSVSVKLPMLQLDRFTVEFQLGTLGEEGYKLLLNKARAEITTNQRKLREPMRRAHQSAQSRGITKLSFEAYLKQEGFGHLLP